jgi:hypothetical protein
MECGRDAHLSNGFSSRTVFCAWLIRRDGTSIRASTDRASNARLSNITRWHKRALILLLLGLAVALMSLFLGDCSVGPSLSSAHLTAIDFTHRI